MLHTTKRRKAKWIGHILRRNCFLQHDTERKIDVISEGKTRKKKLAATGWPYGKDRILGIERGSTRSHYVKNWLLKNLWTCKTNYRMD